MATLFNDGTLQKSLNFIASSDYHVCIINE